MASGAPQIGGTGRRPLQYWRDDASLDFPLGDVTCQTRDPPPHLPVALISDTMVYQRVNAYTTRTRRTCAESRLSQRGPSSRSEFRGYLKRKRPHQLSSVHLGTHSCEDASGESGRTNTGHGISEVRVARIPQPRACRKPELRGCFRRRWQDHLSSWHLGARNCQDVSGETGLTNSVEGISETRVARMSQAKVPGESWGRAPPRSALQGCLRRRWQDHLSPRHVGSQSCEDVSGE
eukprot:5650751-Pyramimonas_sp.AAC.1